MTYKELITERLAHSPFLIMTHRGLHAGNIIQNTIEAAQLAYKAGSDIVEMDVCRSADGQYYLFHNGNEPHLLGTATDFNDLHSEFIDNQSLYNNIGASSGKYTTRLDTFLEWLPDNHLINIDRSWFYWDDRQFQHIIKRSGKTDLIMLKSPVSPHWLDLLNRFSVQTHFVPILYSESEYERVKQYENINIVGVELIIEDLTKDSFSEEWKDQIRSEGKTILVNAEDLGLGYKLFDDINDSKAILENPADSWGTMLANQANIIQTDWPYFLKAYRNELIQ